MSSGSSATDLSTSGKHPGDFLGNYYEHLAAEDAASYSGDTLETRAMAHRELALRRPSGQAVIGIRNERNSSVIMIATDDMPFLVDSVTAEIVRQDLAIRMLMHPTFIAIRDRTSHELVELKRVPAHLGASSGDTAALPNLAEFIATGDKASHIESWISVETVRISGDEKARQVIEGIRKVLGDVRVAVEDWSSMRSRVRQIAASLDSVAGAEEIPDLDEAKELLEWLDNGNFTFLGYREYDLANQAGEDVLLLREGTGLGIMRELPEDRHVQHLTEEGRARAREKRALVITKANSRSTVHRAAYLDYIGVKSFDAQGNVNGERRFIGLFASSAYNRSVRSVPIVREKVDAVLKHSGFAPDSHSGKDLLSILESYPRDEIFQMGTQELADIAMGILRLQERRRTRLFLRQDVYGRFVSALVYLPRDRYTTAVRLRMQDELRKTFEAKAIDYEARMTESSLARLFFRIRLRHGSEVPQIDVADLERRLAAAARSWSEGIDQIVRTKFDGEEAEKLSAKWAEAFPASYRVDYEVEDALEDIARFESYSEKADVSPIMHVYIPADVRTKVEDARLKLYLPEPQSLSQILPVFQNLGLEVLDERPFEIITADGEDFFLYDLGLKYPSEVDPLATGGLVQDAFGAVVTGRSESDRFDRLVVQERVPWREVSMLRSYARYVRQLGYAGSYSFTADTLLANPAVAHALISLFKVRFDPDMGEDSRAAALEQARASLADGLQAVPTLDADRVLRTLANVIEATLRTNYFQNKPYLSFKLRPEAIEGAPFPRPKFEIWVYSPQVEGVHLRFGEVARGGLRWSDRREDFRTEILGLVKAQTVKNAVIVPTGAKGGFYAKQLPDPANDRAAWMAEGQSSYRTFIRGLLDITDNLVRTPAGQQVVPPERVVRLDGDDTYLVVAADKGTASFSDIANEISAEYGHWLGDAFASGGSVGYDHKAMGITARGAWESVKRHFSELGIDTQQEDFTVAGVGDMSGDVFGNGMLLSKHIRLVAAFDHRHIFLDPNPDPATSYTERKRLFELPRSSWADYDTSLISAGGGVYSRSIKSIELSPEVRQALGLNESVTAISPPELLRAILQSPVDLLYNGGIGTYVKASAESNAEVGDKANDNIRVNGKDLRARVVGEGGNLGMTQRGRIEAALNGVILNTDAIDNSAGVDCSDHEVNIKVFVDQLVAAGKLPAAERTELLQSMTDEVGRLVLEDNIDQNVLLLNDRQRVVEWSPSYERLMDWLEKTADLNRELEALPTTGELHERIDKGMGLTSPELSVLAAYAKIELTRALTLSNLADDPYFDKVLRGYFPIPLVERFGSDLALHPLRREIIATVVANDMINMGGITFAFRVMEETSVDEAAVAKAFVTLREIYELDEQVAQLNQLPANFPTEVWSTIHLDIRRLLDRAVRWYVNHTDSATPVGEGIAAFKPLIDPLRTKLVKYLRGNDLERVQEWRQQGEQWGLPETIAHQWAEQFESFGLLDIARIAVRVEEPVDTVAQIYYTVYDRFEVDVLLNRITKLPREDRWQALARAAMRDDLYSTITDMTLAVMNSTEAHLDADDRMQKWVNANSESIERAKKMFEEINQLEHDDMASLSVALRLMRSTVRS